MTARSPATRDRGSWVDAAVAALACGALAVRTVSYASTAVTALVGAVGVLPRVERQPASSRMRWALVVAAGGAAFVAGRSLGSGIGVRLTHPGVAVIVIAAIAEEAFFRRFVYDRLLRHGAAVAIVVSSALFAVIHAPMYGVAVVPLDLAAGLVLGWQRWATGGWSAPAATHVFANLLQMG